MKAIRLLLSALFIISLVSCTNDLYEDLNTDASAKVLSEKPGRGFVGVSPSTGKEISKLQTAIANIRTLDDAMEAGWTNPLTPFIPGMGYHYVNDAYLGDGEFHVDQPEALLIACNGSGEYVVVGVEYLVFMDQLEDPGTPPEGFSGDADVWEVVGPFWTLHAWVKTPNPDGFFNPTNNKIPDTDLCEE